MPCAELNSSYVNDIDGLKQNFGILITVNPEAGSDGMCQQTVRIIFSSGNVACLSQLASIVEYCAGDDISILHSSLSDFLLEKTSTWKVSHLEWLSSVSSADTAFSNPIQRNLRGKDSSRTPVLDCLSVL